MRPDDSPRSAPPSPPSWSGVTEVGLGAPLRVLITSNTLAERSGAVLYARDLALELSRRGHRPAVFASRLGVVADEIQAAGIPVVADPRKLEFHPDVIHGHHRQETMAAIGCHRRVPAIFVSHNHRGWPDAAPHDPQILRYFGVSQVCVDRLIREGAPPDRTGFLGNFVDVHRFVPRAPLPSRPRRALVFSNYAAGDTHLQAVTAACRQAGLEMDVVGAAAGNQASQPEAILGRYDIVFAKAKAAMEAMAVGAAVVLCDFDGVGPMVTSAAFPRLRRMNFGFQTLSAPLDPARLLREIERYDPDDAARVRDLIREGASLAAFGDTVVGIYREVIAEAAARAAQTSASAGARASLVHAREALAGKLLGIWSALGHDRRQELLALPGVALARRAARRLFRVSTDRS